MIWRVRSRSRTICLSLALVTASFYLLLLLASQSMYLQPCDSLLNPNRHVLRDLARHSFSSVGPADTLQGDSSSGDGSRKVKGRGEAPSDGTTARASAPNSELAGSVESGLSKLEALFNHPLYNLPWPPVPEEDRLLTVRPKVTASDETSHTWVSDSPEKEVGVVWSGSSDTYPPWLRFHLGISRWQLYPHRDPNMDELMQQLATHKIVGAVQRSGGTQLKLVMSFPNNGKAMFKPMKQGRDEETNYNLYYFSDFERHNAEISAFHLDRILGYRRIPPVVGRLVDVVKEIKNVTTDRKLARTFFKSPVGSMCFYGQCSYYCSTEHAVCGRPTRLEASMAVFLPGSSLASRTSWKSPWRRSYSRSKLAKWETNPDYCTTVKKTSPYDKGTRLLDFIDMVILDFLMSMFTLRKESDWIFRYRSKATGAISTEDECISL